MKVKKTGKSQYGFYLLVDDGSDKGSFKGTTDKVSNFLANQVPCEIEVEETDDKGKVTRVNVLSKSENSSEAPQTPQQALNTQEPTQQKNVSQMERERLIRAEFCVREGLRAIEVHNGLGEEKIKPTRENILQTANIIDLVIDDLLNQY